MLPTINNQLFLNQMIQKGQTAGVQFNSCTFKECIITADMLGKSTNCTFVKCFFPKSVELFGMDGNAFQSCHFMNVQFTERSVCVRPLVDGGHMENIEFYKNGGIQSLFSHLFHKRGVRVSNITYMIEEVSVQAFKNAQSFLKSVDLKTDKTQKRVNQLVK